MKSPKAGILLLALIFAACGRSHDATDAPAPLDFTATDPMILNAEFHRGAASSIEAADGAVAHAWITLAEDRQHGRLFVRIGESRPIEITDSEAIPVLDPETPPQVAIGPDGDIHLTWPASRNLEGKWSTMAIRYVRSGDGGRSWTAPVSVGTGDPFGGYRNDHEMHVGPDGIVYVSWLDSRFAAEDESAIHVAFSRSEDGGATWTSPVLIDAGASCECCRVGLASGPDGELHAAWRKIFPGSIRDIVVARSSDHGDTWSEPVRVYADDWEMGYCPDAGPSIRADDAGRLHVAWWTGKKGSAGVKIVRSTDGGRTFERPAVLSLADLSRASHVQIAPGGEDRLAVVWDDGTLESPRIALAASTDGGRSYGPIRYLSPGGVEATYPAAAWHAGGLDVIWHERGAGEAMTRHPTGDPGLWRPHPADAGPGIGSVSLFTD